MNTEKKKMNGELHSCHIRVSNKVAQESVNL